MSRETITKICVVVISLTAFCLISAACSPVSSSVSKNGNDNNNKNVSAGYEKPRVAGTISSGEIDESSGIAASRCAENVLWTHNDSGDDAYLFAINTKGEKLGTWKVPNAKNNDWEDIAAFKNAKGECFLYVGDIGNNERLKSEMTIYKVREPKISGADKSSSKKNPIETENAERIKYGYPDMRRDAETLLVHPQTGDIYILSKSFSQPSGVYKLAANYNLNKTNTLKKIADFAVPAIPNGLLTGGDISFDGRRVVLCDYFGGYEITLPKDAGNFDEIWKQTPQVIDLGAREQGEAVCYSIDGKSVFATSEKRNQPLIRVKSDK